MKQLVVQENFAFIYLNTTIYSQNSIKTTLNAFREFIIPSLTSLGNYTVVKYELLTSHYTLEEIGNELLNYILGINKQEGGE